MYTSLGKKIKTEETEIKEHKFSLYFIYNLDIHLKHPKLLSGMRWSLGVKSLIILNPENACKIPQSHLRLFGDNWKPICATAYTNHTFKSSKSKW